MDPPGYEKITQNFGFNHLATNTRIVQPADQLFLRRENNMQPLGTYREARMRAGTQDGAVVGSDGINYGDFDTPEINDNLFIRRQQLPLPSNVNPRSFASIALDALSTSYLPNVQDVMTTLPKKLTFSNNGNALGKSKRRRRSSKRQKRVTYRRRKRRRKPN
jgi:hypothetical protein